MITIFYFAGLREAAGKSQEQAELAGHTVSELLAWVGHQYPHLPL